MKGLILSTMLAIAVTAHAAFDKKFYEKAAQEAWGVDLPMMNATAPIPNEIAEGQSAVIIGIYHHIEADWEQGRSVTKAANTGKIESTLTTYTNIDRVMVKLLDQSAVEHYTDFDFGSQARTKIQEYTLSKMQNAFGARIFKPDGSVRDIDLSEAFVETSGKKGKDEAKRKIAIPGLEVGDVLEYFYYRREELDEVSPGKKVFPFVMQYPVLNYIIYGEFDPHLTVEYRSVNGAHQLNAGSRMDNKNNVLTMHVTNISAAPQESWINRYRQLPYIELHVINNNSTFTFRPKTSRGGGVFDAVAGTYYNDIRSVLPMVKNSESKVFKRAESIVKDFAKAHPQASRKEVADATWLALIYSTVVEKRKPSDFFLATYMYDILKKQGLANDADTGIGVTSSRNDFALSDILGWDEPDYLTIVGEDAYFYGVAGDYLPAELPGSYHGEDVMCFLGDREAFTDGYMPAPRKIYTSKMTQNSLKQNIVVSIEPQAECASLKYQAEATGATKGRISLPQDVNDYLTSVENFLGMPEKNRHKRQKTDSVEFNNKTRDFLKSKAEDYIGVAPDSILSYAITAHGNLPGSEVDKWQMECIVPGITEDLGDAISVNVGKLFGTHKKLSAKERDRYLDVNMPNPSQMLNTIVIEVPEGYEPDYASIEALAHSTATPVGQVIVQATATEDNNVTINFVHRLRQNHVPVEKWGEFAVLVDAASDLSGASIVLKKK